MKRRISKTILGAIALVVMLLVAASGARANQWSGPVTSMGVKICQPTTGSASSASATKPYYSAMPLTYIVFGGFSWDITQYDNFWGNVGKGSYNITMPSAPSMFATLANLSFATGAALSGGCATCAQSHCSDGTSFWVLENLSISK